MSIILTTLLALVAFLIWERIMISRMRRKIPLVISVTGTRGKSSTARSLGSVFREAGRRVLVKTTGTEARFVLPDGSSEEVPRRGSATVLEQKSVLRKAVRCRADVLVAEVMSIEPENHVIESERILRPDVVVITNIRRDHTESMGQSLEEIADTISRDAAPHSRVFVSESSLHLFKQARSAGWEAVPPVDTLPDAETRRAVGRFHENDGLVVAVCRSMGLSEEAIARGLKNATMDRGGFSIWRHTSAGKTAFVANAFAANDPESTAVLLERSKALLGHHRPCYGLFAVRSDRVARTLQWIEALDSDEWSVLKEVFLVGDATRAVSRKIRRSAVLSGNDPARITQQAITRMEDGALLFGFGNTHGIGLQLVDHWMKEGTIYGT